MSNFAVIGAGNGGCSIATHLTLKGHSVYLYNRMEEAFKPICDQGGLYYCGELGKGYVDLSYVGSDLHYVMSKAEQVIIVVPRHTHELYAKLLQPELHPGLGIAIIPGSGTSLLFRTIWEKEIKTFGLELMETCTLPYSTRLENPTTVNIYQVRQNIGAVCLTGYNSCIWTILNSIFSFQKMKCVIQCILANMNPILHPAGMLLNAGWIENDCDCLFYKEASSPAVCKVMEAADRERRNIASAFGLPAPSLIQQFYDAKYTNEKGLAGGTIYSALQNSKPNSKIKCPKNLKDRYLVEDVSTGLVAFSALGKLVHVATPIIDSLIQLASVVNDMDYFQHGMNLDKMGLAGYNSASALQIGAEMD